MGKRASRTVLAWCALLALVGCRDAPTGGPKAMPAVCCSPAGSQPPSAPAPAPASEPPTYVGSAACAGCHAEQARLHAQSTHARAMAKAEGEAVLGRFDGSTQRSGRKRARFVRDGADAAGFAVELGEGGAPSRHAVTHTFGTFPLQQYLVATERGRYQALPFAWDSRPAAQGGQRWFDLATAGLADPGQALHWQGPLFNWNAQCADCHSTNVVKGYARDTDSYDTRFSEISVGCEACHGPGSAHVRAAAAGQKLRPPRPLTGPARRWTFAADAAIARLEAAPADAAPRALEACAACHARRADLGPAAGDQVFADRYRLALLEPELYAPDGQIEDEVFELGSFLQSKMHAAGVVCGDCHEPHSQALRASGNALCAQCHSPGVFDSPAHHLHAAGSAGAECVACHMPTRRYMGVDDRHDHRFGVPRPDRHATLGVRDACSGCHATRDAAWAAAALRSAGKPAPDAGWPETLQAARTHQPGAEAQLLALVQDRSLPAISRATALGVLADYPSPESAAALEKLRADPSELVRRSVPGATVGLPPELRVRIVTPLLGDAVRSVRLEAITALLNDPLLDAAQASRYSAAFEEQRAAGNYNADRANGLAELATLALRQAQPGLAEGLLRTAVAREPWFGPAYVNLADLYRTQSRDPEGAQLLREGLPRVVDAAALHHALGLTLVRMGERAQALTELKTASQLAPGDVQYGYVYAIALSESDVPQAIAVLRALQALHPAEPRLAAALASYTAQVGGATPAGAAR
jgi:predicted CXXCH cytochrome family protein